jgi:hypothetical protein
MSVSVLESDLSDQPKWQSADVSGTIGKQLLEIASIVQIDPSDARADMDLLTEAFRKQKN